MIEVNFLKQPSIARILTLVSILLFLFLIPWAEQNYAIAKGTKCDAQESTNSSQAHLKQVLLKLYGDYKIGYKVLSLPGKTKIAVWYPTDSQEAVFEYKIGASKIESKLSHNGKVNKGKYPLIFYAHGAVGCGLSSFFICESLARNGFIVAAPDFSDSVFASRIDRVVPTSKEKTEKIWDYLYSLRDNGLDNNAKLGRKKFSYRPKELSWSIDYLKSLGLDKNSPFFKHIDSEHIGIVGHSFGAWTAILISGAEKDYARDDIDALVCLSGPSNQNVFTVSSDNDLAKIKCPVMFQYGAKEKLFKDRQDEKYLYNKANQPKVLACIANCNHFTFSCGSGKQFSIASDYISKSLPRATICHLVLGFFDSYLKPGIKPPKCIKEKTEGVFSLKSDIGTK